MLVIEVSGIPPEGLEVDEALSPGEVHIEGAEEKEVIVYFSMQSTTDVIYETLNPDLSLMRSITVQDFARDLQSWSV